MSSTRPLPAHEDRLHLKDSSDHYAVTMAEVGYITRKEATVETYRALGFKCGLEIHQQLKTAGKLFCRCPARIYQKPDEYDAEIVRHMRPTLSELGEYDGTALMEFKTRKTIIYRLRNASACTYEIDDTPPFLIDQDALRIALRVALLLRMTIVGELHIARKQYLDGSIPTGFQRTGIVAIEGSFPIRHKSIRIIQLSIEEDSCREVSDVGHLRIFRTDRLGMPLIETVTYPDMLTPDEAAEAAEYLRKAARSSGEVRTGIGAAREDVNVSITGGTRVEIKGVAKIRAIPELTHNEAFRQKSLLCIKDRLVERGVVADKWRVSTALVPPNQYVESPAIRTARLSGQKVVAVNLPQFGDLLSFFTQPGRVFADELADRLKVIAGLERPNMLYSDMCASESNSIQWGEIAKLLKAGTGDAQILVWGADEDMKTAIETIEERCRLAVIGVPNETRQSMPDGTTRFERVLPGPDRMYPDTDSAPVSIDSELLETLRQSLPDELAVQSRKLSGWGVPVSVHDYLIRRNLVSLVEEISIQSNMEPRRVAILLGQTLRHHEGRKGDRNQLSHDAIRAVFAFLKHHDLHADVADLLFRKVFEYPDRPLSAASLPIPQSTPSRSDIVMLTGSARQLFRRYRRSIDPEAEINWIMGELRPHVIGRVAMAEVRQIVTGVVANG